LQNICLGWPPTVILQILASQVGRITGFSCWCRPHHSWWVNDTPLDRCGNSTFSLCIRLFMGTEVESTS
jgi:hypothetical protein